MTLIAMLSSAHTARTLCGIFLMAVASSGCSKESESKEKLLSRASGYLASAQYDKAEKEYREVLRLDAGRSCRAPPIGDHLPRSGPIAAGLSASRKPRNRSRTIADLQLKLGQTLLATGQVQQAREAALRSSRSSREKKRRSC